MIDNKTSKFFRGIAILMVIGSHYAAGMYVDAVRPAAKAFVESLGSYGVDIFFLLSGYGLVKSYEKSGITRQYVLRRLFNTYVPYIVIIGFFEAVIDRRISDFKSFVTLITGGDYWFMHTLFFMYVVFMIVYRINVFKEALITLAIVGYTIFMYKDGRNAFWSVSNGAFLLGIYAASFEGEVCGRIKARLQSVREKFDIKNANLILAGFAVMLIAWFAHSSGGGILVQMIMNISFSLAVLGICMEVKGGGVIVPTLGKYTLYIYLLHMRLFWIIVEILPDWSYAKLAVVTSLISLVICVVFGYVMERCIGWMLKKLGAG